MKKPMLVDRPKMTLEIDMPVDVVDDLKLIAKEKDMSNVNALIRFYVGQGLRRDLKRKVRNR